EMPGLSSPSPARLPPPPVPRHYGPARGSIPGAPAINGSGLNGANGRPSLGRPAAVPQGLDVSRLLAGLQRGAVPGANGNIDFLCHKFSGLLERLQKSEAGEREALESCAQLEAQLVTKDLEEDAERRELEAADAAAREEIRKFESSLTEVLCGEVETKEQLSAVRAETEALAVRRRSLEELCLSDRAKLAETNASLRHKQLSRPEGRDDLRRLQGQLQTFAARCVAADAEI
ncbi:unnamed protein product, partial [Polarella glacialis]